MKCVYFFEEITGIRSQVLSTFGEKSEVDLGDLNFVFCDMSLQMGANGASGQELQIAPKNRFHTFFFEKIMELSLSILNLFSTPFCMKCKIEFTTRTYSFTKLVVGSLI
jgi:hypothetical protein